MKKRVERLRGMHDILPETHQHQRWLRDHLETFLAQAGYAAVDSPLVERSDLFQASFGQELWQNLYTFRLHHRDLCLRPEYTASICRLYLDHYQQHALPQRFQYAGPVFRYETPGRSRYRQHTQLGVELIGGQPAFADAEILELACAVLNGLHIANYRLELGHIEVASGFINRLHLDDQAARLLLSLMEQISRSEEGERQAQKRLEKLYPLSPLQQTEMDAAAMQAEVHAATARGTSASLETHHLTALLNGMSISFGDDSVRDEVIDRFLWKTGRGEQRRQILYALEFLRALHAVSGPPPMVFDELGALLERYELSTEAIHELQQLVTVAEQCGVPREQIILNLSLGRGVSYYTGLVFEIHAQDADGFDAQLCGGGRYDRLMRAVGSARDVHACGFAFGLERLLSYVPKTSLPPLEMTEAMVIPLNGQVLPYALHVAQAARTQGIRTEVDITGHGVGTALKQAAKRQIRLALIVGEDEQRTRSVTVRDLLTGEEQVVLVEMLAGQMGDKEQSL